jgi:SAM-dependent methyltransferase
VTAVWLDRPGAAPCLALLQRSAAGDLATAAMWNNEFVASATLNREPNAWLVENVRGVKPGRALDVASGEGRNTVWLAKQGWQATGFDLAGEGLRITQERAKAEGVPVETSFADAFAYDFGNARWNLILFSYAPLRGLEAKAAAGLAPGGLVVVEAFHDSAAPNRAGGGVFYASGELARRFREVGLEIVREEEPVRRADYGGGTVRLVQLVARKPG